VKTQDLLGPMQTLSGITGITNSTRAVKVGLHHHPSGTHSSHCRQWFNMYTKTPTASRDNCSVVLLTHFTNSKHQHSLLNTKRPQKKIANSKNWLKFCHPWNTMAFNH